MIEILIAVAVALLAVVIVLLLVLLQRQSRLSLTPLLLRLDALEKGGERVERGLKDEISRNREESNNQARGLREELALSLKGFNDSVLKQMADVATLQKNQLETFAGTLMAASQNSEQKIEAMRDTLEKEFKALLQDNGQRLEMIRQDATAHAKQSRDETVSTLKSFNDSVLRSVSEMTTQHRGQMEGFSAQLVKLSESNEKKIEQLKVAVETRLTQIQQDNAIKLEEMRKTVDEKLQGALEKRLGESFKLVSERLEQVHKGLGEMQSLANGVGDLKKVLTNVKTRGTWGEVQLGNLLEQILTQDQFAANVTTKVGSTEHVEFAIKLPGRDELEGNVVWLPIDAKFPKEDYERLVEAADRADITALEEVAKQLELRIKAEARNIRDKYLDPPHTTDFGILFLSTEGLYAEALRRPGLIELLQREYRVNVAGPTTLAALLNSLQMGFRTLAIQRRSSEVWTVLGAIKTEFGKFGEIIDRVQQKLQDASNVIEDAGRRSRVIERKLRKVQELPAADATALLSSTAEAVLEDTDELPNLNC